MNVEHEMTIFATLIKLLLNNRLVNWSDFSLTSQHSELFLMKSVFKDLVCKLTPNYIFTLALY